jgi:Domain of unknown function DUF11/Divergent InlB B-repeat domain
MGSPRGLAALAAAVAGLVLAAGAGGARLDGPFSIDDTVSPGTISPGGSATISINASNNGSDAASMYVVFDLDPGDWSLGGASQTPGPSFSCSTSQYDMTCNIGTWPAGTSASFTIPLHLGSTLTQGQIKNTRDYIFQGQPGGGALASSSFSIQVGAPAPAPAPPAPAPPATATLALTHGGAGSGSITSSPAGIDCGTTCSHGFAQGTSVTLTEAAAAGSLFAGWDGACKSAGTASTCTVTLSGDAQVSASFDVAPPPPKPVPPKSTPLHKATQHADCTVGRLPDRDCTPGAVFGIVAPIDLCTAGYAAGVAPVSDATRRQVFAAYGIPKRREASYVLDHLVPVALGGSNDRANLWPEATAKPPAAHEKNRLEAYLLGRVCKGAIQLDRAQVAIAQNWLAEYHRARLG